MKSISIVIPTYNREHILIRTLESIRSLFAGVLEVLVVDQTEEHEEVTKRYLEMNAASGVIRWLRHHPPGVVGAMNRGLREAKGDIVLFLDDDIVPHQNLVAAHLQAHAEYPDAWAVVGQVIQRDNAETLKTEMLKGKNKTGNGRPQSVDCEQESGNCELGDEPQSARDDKGHHIEDADLKTGSKDIFLIRIIRKISGFFSSDSSLRKDLDFDFSGKKGCWVENVMAGNLSVKREKVLALGGFDENFIPPVSFRFETEFAKRIVTAGGKIRFEPKGSIFHLRVASGGTRVGGGHLKSASALHGVGDYYYALKHGRGLDRIGYILRRPYREVCTKFHLRHPWWIPIKMIGELRAMALAFLLYRSTTNVFAPGNNNENVKRYYDDQYSGCSYAAYTSQGYHSFHGELEDLISRYGQVNGRWLEVGCGRGLLQDVVDDYTGVDIAETVVTYLHKPFFCAPVEQLPYPDSEFDGIWSYAVLEHVIDPEKAMLEMRRVLRPGGILILAPAWQCRPWASRDYTWKPYLELCLKDRFLKALIPLRNSVVFRSVFIMPRRFLRLLVHGILRRPMRFRYRSLTPCYEAYHVADADARHSMDPFEAILWFRSRGDRVLSHPNLINAILIRTGAIVVEVNKRIANEKMEECQ